MKLLFFADEGKCALPKSISSDCLGLQHDIHFLEWSKHGTCISILRNLLYFASSLPLPLLTLYINSLPIASKTSIKTLGHHLK